MRLGLQVNRFAQPGGDAAIGPAFADIAGRAEDAGFASLWVMDHFFQIPMVGPADEPMLEGYAALAFAAGVTRRITLGTMVTGVTYRHPAVLVKTATTLDVLSGGRAYLGIGAAWFEREHAGLGVPFPPVKERFERLEETLQIAHQMWRGEAAPYEGRHYRLTETLCRPLSVSQPHPPILIGGAGSKRPCVSWRVTPTRAISSRWTLIRCAASSTCCAATAKRKAARTRRSRRRPSAACRASPVMAATAPLRRPR